MIELFNENIEPEKALPVRGSFLLKILRALRSLRIRPGWGLLGDQTGEGVTLSLDPSVLAGAVIYARLGDQGGESEYEYTWEEVKFNLQEAVWETGSNARTQTSWGYAVCLNLGKAAFKGMVVRLEPKLDARTGRRYMLATPTPRVVPVDVNGDGDDGVWQVSEPTYVYTFNDKSGAVLSAAAQSPMNQRMKAPYLIADEGWAYLDDSVPGAPPTWKLGLVNEEAVIPEATTGGVDRWGYWRAQGAGADGNAGETRGGAASEEGAAGNGGILLFAGSKCNSGTDAHIPVYTKVDEGVGTDTVIQWADFSAYMECYGRTPGDVLMWDASGNWLPAALADEQGYEEVEDDKGNSLAKTDGGVIRFETATPSVNEVAVDFTVTAADPKAKVTAVVDLTGYTTTGTGAGSTILDKEIRVNRSGTSGTDHIIDGDNYSGRMIHYAIAVVSNADLADWTDTAAAFVNAGTNNTYIGSAESADITVGSSFNGCYFYIDVSDGYQLKMRYDNGTHTAGKIHYVRLHVIKGARKTAADQTIN